jgi:hypothetical protein
MVARGKVMVSYPLQCEHGGVGLEKETEQKEDGRYIVFYTFGDEEEGED